MPELSDGECDEDPTASETANKVDNLEEEMALQKSLEPILDTN